jgi:hypothetical protein
MQCFTKALSPPELPGPQESSFRALRECPPTDAGGEAQEATERPE